MWIADDRCFECGAPKEEDHHVVPKIWGGTRSLPLCKKHHDLAHGRKIRVGRLIAEGRRRAREEAEAEGRDLPGVKLSREVRQRILDLRIWHGLTQEEIADELNLSQPTVSKFLKSAGHPGQVEPTNQRPLFAEEPHEGHPV